MKNWMLYSVQTETLAAAYTLEALSQIPMHYIKNITKIDDILVIFIEGDDPEDAVRIHDNITKYVCKRIADE